MEKLYVLAGKARSGKDSIGKYLCEYYSTKKIIKISCSLYLKDFVQKIYDWGGYDEDKPRDILQSLGNEIRKKYPDIFVQRMVEDIKVLREYCDVIIVTGVRLTKELLAFKEFGAVCIKVVRDEDNGLTFKQKEDITETEVDKFNDYDYVVLNNGSLDDLREKTIEMCKEVL